jgi:ubiquitin C-terminal hydrolase
MLSRSGSGKTNFFNRNKSSSKDVSSGNNISMASVPSQQSSQSTSISVNNHVASVSSSSDSCTSTVNQPIGNNRKTSGSKNASRGHELNISSMMVSVSNRLTASFPGLISGQRSVESSPKILAATIPSSSSKTKALKRLEVGLENLGNTCFANSSLQCLLHIVPLAKFFLEADIKSCVNRSSPMKGDLASSFSELIRDVYRANTGSCVSPLKFLRAVSRYAPHLLDNNQQDCQEFLRFVLDGICEDLCRKRAEGSPSTKRPPVEDNSISPANLAMSPRSILRLQQQQQRQQQQHGTSPTKLSILSPTLPSLHQGGLSPIASNGEASNRSRSILTASKPIGTPAAASSSSKKFHFMEVVGSTHRETASANDEATDNDSELDDTIASSPSKRLPQLHPRSRPLHGLHPKPRHLPTLQPIAQSQQQQHLPGGSDDLHLLHLANAGVMTPKSPSSPKRRYHNRSLLSRRKLPSRDLSDDFAMSSSSESNNTMMSPTIAIVEEPTAVTAAVVKQPSIQEEAEKAWKAYMKFNDSVISDLFAGQLQSTIECSSCQHRSYCFDPFLDLSVPIPIGNPNALSRGYSSESQPAAQSKSHFLSKRSIGLQSHAHHAQQQDPAHCSLEECIDQFVKEEVLEGENMVTCDHCKQKRRCVKRMSIYRNPRVLVIHIKRFRFNHSNHHRDKLLTDVNFPVHGLDLSPYLSIDRCKSDGEEEAPIYDLVGVSNHSGNMSGGHYIAHINTNFDVDESSSEQRWMCFNDARVSVAQPTHIAGPSAYVLFYRLRSKDGQSADTNPVIVPADDAKDEVPAISDMIL